MVELIFRHNETERISNLSLRTDHLTLRHPSKQLCVLRKLKFILKREILEKIYLAYIRPLLEYSCEVWDICSQMDKTD
jgi:hypothetical protein